MYQDAPLEEVVKRENRRSVTFSIWLRGPATLPSGEHGPIRSVLLMMDAQEYQTIPALCQDVADLMRLHASLLPEGAVMRFVAEVSR